MQKALALKIQCNLSDDQYQIIRNNSLQQGADIYPTLHQLLEYKSTCYPNNLQVTFIYTILLNIFILLKYLSLIHYFALLSFLNMKMMLTLDSSTLKTPNLISKFHLFRQKYFLPFLH